MKRITSAVIVAMFALTPALSAVGGKNAQYIGGTINGIKEGAEGRLSTAGETEAIFDSKDGKASIPYASITGLEYGQKAGRRVAVAVLVSPLALFSKKRNHYLTISYTDPAGKDQAGVFELGKDVVRTTLTVLETRTGKKVEYQDDEARKAGRGN